MQTTFTTPTQIIDFTVTEATEVNLKTIVLSLDKVPTIEEEEEFFSINPDAVVLEF